MQLIQVMQDVFNRPPIEFDPTLQSLKGWAMYCLRDRGFKVVYAQNADFAIETREGTKVYFKVTEVGTELDQSVGWIVRDRTTKQVQIVPPSA